ncbi:unnamed protein product [Rotaria sordida]|uniref:Helicase ARIP4-like n=1 Tax=Rotaria sordida TaxID=392033 RepID=A0A818R493_9BILA|nr:unnamed protein product [Rotaria sordida]
MVDSLQIDTFDNWFLNMNETVNDNTNQTSSASSFLSSLPVLSSNESYLPITDVPSLSNNEEENKIKKRKNEQKTDLNENKKSKQAPSYMRRNIRHLLTNDQLQVDTLSALKAEQDRLRRLEEINQHFYPMYTHTSTNNSNQLKKIINEQECIVLDDDENEQANLSTLNINLDTSTRRVDNDDDDDDSDSDVQSINGDTDFVNDKLSKRLQRLHVDDRVNIPDHNGNILININHPSDDPDLYIPKHLCSILKPHQIGGIRFMYDNIVESLQRFQTTPGLGCILAHSMGCGKTLQIITFIDTLLRYTTAKSVLVVVPINTIQNWASEFNRWCPLNDPNIEYKRSFQLYILNEISKKFDQRAQIVQNWSQTGGTLIIGYEMFRLMVTKKYSQTGTLIKSNNYNKKVNISSPSTSLTLALEDNEKILQTMEDIRNTLISSDLVICDEGHRIKNHQASVAMALKLIKTQRRIVLTGYPLQNNLIEYWCMVDFVRPNYLGSKQEFCNMFERPIINGQCVDSTSEDEQIMRARAHVLHSLLEGFIQRRGHDVLQADLPPKTEYVMLLKLSSVQRQLYMKFLEAVGALSNSSERTLNPLRAFAICCKIWNHADVLYKFVRDRQDGSDVDLDLEIDQNSNTTKTKSNNRLTLNNRVSPISPLPTTTAMNQIYEGQTSMYLTDKKEFDYDFANSILNSYICGQLSNGIKFEVALTIIDLSIKAGDKVLLFSQSLLSLNKLEEFLSQRQIPGTEQKWQKNLNYYRLDGSTNSLEREKLINAFNAPNSNAKLFLLSTRAGCLGINLVSANRVIVMDVSWNPCLDAQAICRIYRYGQKKHCYIYRLIADFTMEKRIYDRQIAKQGMSHRVVDELQPQNQFTGQEVRNLIHFAAEEEPTVPDLITKIDEISDDSILLSICKQYPQSITKIPFTHESLLLDQKEYQLTSAEKRRAQKEYQYEKRMKTYLNRSRFNSSRYSSFMNNNSRYLNENIQPSNYSNLPTIESRYPIYNNYQTPNQKLEELKQKGITIQLLTLQSPLEVQMNGFERGIIPAGVKVHLIKSHQGSYIRTPDGKFFAIRQSTSTEIMNPKSMPVALPPPPPPLPPPSTSSYDLLDELLLDSSSLPSTNLSSSSLTDNLNDEIDLLFDDLNVTLPPSSSTFENINLWDNDCFQQNNLDLDLFLNQSNISVSSNNINNNNNNRSKDDIDLFPESIIYFYPAKEDLMRQKLVDCGEIIGLIQYFKYDLFSSIPKEFNFKKSFVICQHYGRHCAFLVLSKDRFISDEANIHLNHILQLFNMLYGTFNHIQSTYPDIHQIRMYLKQTLTPITEYIFNENRSIKNLFSTIDYAPLKQNNRQCLFNIKHLLNHLQSKYEIKDGLFAYEKRILYSTLDSDTTFYLQANEIYIPLEPETKLKNGVSLIRIYIRRPLRVQPILNAINVKMKQDTNLQIPSEPINIIMPLLLEKNKTSSLNIHLNSTDDSLSSGIQRQFDLIIQKDLSDALGETTSFDTDRPKDSSSPNKTKINGIIPSVNNKESTSMKQFSKDEFNSIFSSKSQNELLSDSQKRRHEYERSNSIVSLKIDKESLNFNDSIDKVTIVPIDNDDYENDFSQEDIICLPLMSSISNFHRTRQRTHSNPFDFNDVEHNDSDHCERHAKWDDVSEKNDETERDELVLYVQRNSRMMFAGIIEKHLLSEEYLQKLWCLMVTEMADMDREIQVIPTAGEISKHNVDIKFQFNGNTHQAQFERLLDINNRCYYKTPSSDHACMAFSARTKLNQSPERKMIGLS